MFSGKTVLNCIKVSKKVSRNRTLNVINNGMKKTIGLILWRLLGFVFLSEKHFFYYVLVYYDEGKLGNFYK